MILIMTIFETAFIRWLKPTAYIPIVDVGFCFYSQNEIVYTKSLAQLSKKLRLKRQLRSDLSAKHVHQATGEYRS